jgi:hypothetical protein
MYRGADKSSARPTSRSILFDGENISFDASLVTYVYNRRRKHDACYFGAPCAYGESWYGTDNKVCILFILGFLQISGFFNILLNIYVFSLLVVDISCYYNTEYQLKAVFDCIFTVHQKHNRISFINLKTN